MKVNLIKYNLYTMIDNILSVYNIVKPVVTISAKNKNLDLPDNYFDKLNFEDFFKKIDFGNCNYLVWNEKINDYDFIPFSIVYDNEKFNNEEDLNIYIIYNIQSKDADYINKLENELISSIEKIKYNINNLIELNTNETNNIINKQHNNIFMVNSKWKTI